MAYRLGSHSGTTVSRYERGGRLPDLDTALTLEVIFGAPVAALFAGRRQKVEREVRRRVARLQEQRSAEESKPSLRKLQAPAAIRKPDKGNSALAQ